MAKTVKPSISKVHPDLRDLRFFDTEPCEMDLNIGRRVRFKKPRCLAEEDKFTIIATQLDYSGRKVYRVVGDLDFYKFGCCAAPEAIEFTDTHSTPAKEL